MRRLLAIIFYLCIFGGLAEIATRYYFSGIGPLLVESNDPNVLGGLMPNQSIVLRPILPMIPLTRVNVNQDGLRVGGVGEVESTKESVASTSQIFCIGDEVTFGLGVADEEAYPTLLRGLLKTRANQTHQVFNAGVPGFGPKEEQTFLKSKKHLVSASTIILQISSDDLSGTQGTPSRFAYEGKAGDLPAWQMLIGKNLALYNGYRFLRKQASLNHLNNSPERVIQSPVDFFGQPRDLSQLMREWQKTGDLWQDLCLSAKRNNKNIVVVVVPHARQMKDGAGVDLYQNPIKQIFSRECQVGVVDPLDKFRQASQNTPLYFENTNVLNSAGNLLLAKILAQEIYPQ